MKHSLKVTIFLVALFVLSQVVGLSLILKEAKVESSVVGNETITDVSFNDTSVGPRPETQGAGSFWYVIIAIGIGTILVLLIVKYGKIGLWKTWYFMAVWMAMGVALGAIIKGKIIFDYDMALGLAVILAAWKLFRPNIYVNNISEVLIYSGIGLLLVPIFDVFWVIMLLLAISVYDMYAVWKSQHMVKMAKFQTNARTFAGLMVHYDSKEKKIVHASLKKNSKSKKSSGSLKTAILGGGDIAFPLIFTGTVMNGLLIEGLTKPQAFLHASIITLCTTIALAGLFIMAKKDKFYPAMPFITAGCLIGWVIVLLV